MNRSTLQRLSRLRIEEARALLDSGHPPGAYYLAGYAIECALKACIAKGVRQHDFPDRRLANDAHTHDLHKLVRAAGLAEALEKELRADPAFQGYWFTIERWDPTARYDEGIPRARAEAMVSACASPRHGVLEWISRMW